MDGGVNYNYVQLLDLLNRPGSGSGSVKETKAEVRVLQQNEHSSTSSEQHGPLITVMTRNDAGVAFYGIKSKQYKINRKTRVQINKIM